MELLKISSDHFGLSVDFIWNDKPLIMDLENNFSVKIKNSAYKWYLNLKKWKTIEILNWSNRTIFKIGNQSRVSRNKYVCWL
jgi:hypothetical protein